ncbi:MAG: NnrU family protein [Rhodobacteraceae bacterium]|nr:NnrU family protein [Paracoccaceae bacterium]
MALLVLGLILWIGAHLFKRLAPDARAGMGEQKGRGLVALTIGLGLVLIIFGYRQSAIVDLWYPPAFLSHVNNLLMLLAMYLFGLGAVKGRLAQLVRHPQLTAVKTWALAHLLVNGDLASILLFGGIMGWAVAEVVLINKAEPAWTPPETVNQRGDLLNVAYALTAFVVVAVVHNWLGYYPFG